MGTQKRQFSRRRCCGLRCVGGLGTTLGEVLRKQLEVGKGEKPEQGGARWRQEPETKEESAGGRGLRRVVVSSGKGEDTDQESKPCLTLSFPEGFGGGLARNPLPSRLVTS